MSNSNDDYHVRLAKAEAGVASLSKSVDQIASSVEELADSVHAGFRDIHSTLGDELSKVYDRVNKSQQTNWPTIFSGVAVLITIIIIILTVYNQQQAVQNYDIKTLQEWQIEEAYNNGKRDQQIENQGEEIETIKSSIKEFSSKT